MQAQCIIARLLVIALAGASAVESAAADDDLAAIIAKVRANESLYENIDIVMSTDFELTNPKVGHDRSLQSARSITRYISQHGMFYLKIDDLRWRTDKDSHQENTVQGFDGSMTRVYEQNAIANIHEGRVEDPRLLRTHSMLLSRYFVFVPLSQFLQGSAALKDDPHLGTKIIAVESLGEELVDNEACDKVQIEMRDQQWAENVLNLAVLWLAHDKNYFPLRVEFYVPHISKSLPCYFCTNSDFREVAPGVWFPFHSRAVGYVANGPAGSLESGEHVEQDTTDIHVGKVILSPVHDVALFRDVTFPEGTPVHRVRDGKIVESWTEHHEQPPTTQSDPEVPSQRHCLLITTGVALVALAIAVWIYSRKARRA